MQRIDDKQSLNQTLFDNIDRIIHASRIEEIQELKRLIRFIDHLIQSLIHQIANGLLSEKGARIKILHCFYLIQHCQIGNHPTIKIQMDKIKQLFENKYKEPLHRTSSFKPKVMILSASDIRHYVESIQDSQQDPIYSEQPKEPQKNQKNLKKPSRTTKLNANQITKQDINKNKIVTSHYLSTLFSHPNTKKESW